MREVMGIRVRSVRMRVEDKLMRAGNAIATSKIDNVIANGRIR